MLRQENGKIFSIKNCLLMGDLSGESPEKFNALPTSSPPRQLLHLLVHH